MVLALRSAPKVLGSPLANVAQKRFNHDLMLRKHGNGKPIVRYGPGGRSSASGHVATVFGCTGFLGRYIVSKLAKQGTQVITPFRDEDSKRHLKVTGDLGQVVALEFDLRDREQILEAVRHSDIVYNLVGRTFETKNFNFNQVNAEGAQRLAEICAEAGVPRFVHVSALNASEDSPSAYLRSKAAGEKAVKDVFPDATIVRPAMMYGHEDKFLNVIGSGKGWPFYVNEGKAKIRPVHVMDVAQALEIMQTAESTMGKTYELYGPKEMTYADIFELARDITRQPLKNFNIPKPVVKLMATALDKMPFAYVSPDEIERYSLDDKLTPGAHTFADLYIDPVNLEDVAIQFLRRFRSTAYFDQPYEKGDGNAMQTLESIVDLIELYPEQRELLLENLRKYVSELDAKDEQNDAIRLKKSALLSTIQRLHRLAPDHGVRLVEWAYEFVTERVHSNARPQVTRDSLEQDVNASLLQLVRSVVEECVDAKHTDGPIYRHAELRVLFETCRKRFEASDRQEASMAVLVALCMQRPNMLLTSFRAWLAHELKTPRESIWRVSNSFKAFVKAFNDGVKSSDVGLLLDADALMCECFLSMSEVDRKIASVDDWRRFVAVYLMIMPHLDVDYFHDIWPVIFRRLYQDFAFEEMFAHEQNEPFSCGALRSNGEPVYLRDAFAEWMQTIAFKPNGPVLLHAADVLIMLDKIANYEPLRMSWLLPAEGASIVESLRSYMNVPNLSPPSIDAMDWVLSLFELSDDQVRSGQKLQIPFLLLHLLTFHGDSSHTSSSILRALIVRLDTLGSTSKAFKNVMRQKAFITLCESIAGAVAIDKRLDVFRSAVDEALNGLKLTAAGTDLSRFYRNLDCLRQCTNHGSIPSALSDAIDDSVCRSWMPFLTMLSSQSQFSAIIDGVNVLYNAKDKKVLSVDECKYSIALMNDIFARCWMERATAALTGQGTDQETATSDTIQKLGDMTLSMATAQDHCLILAQDMLDQMCIRRRLELSDGTRLSSDSVIDDHGATFSSLSAYCLHSPMQSSDRFCHTSNYEAYNEAMTLNRENYIQIFRQVLERAPDGNAVKEAVLQHLVHTTYNDKATLMREHYDRTASAEFLLYLYFQRHPVLWDVLKLVVYAPTANARAMLQALLKVNVEAWKRHGQQFVSATDPRCKYDATALFRLVDIAKAGQFIPQDWNIEPLLPQLLAYEVGPMIQLGLLSLITQPTSVIPGLGMSITTTQLQERFTATAAALNQFLKQQAKSGSL